MARKGGIQSIPYDVAIRHNPMRQAGRPIAKKKGKRPEKHERIPSEAGSGDKPNS